MSTKMNWRDAMRWCLDNPDGSVVGVNDQCCISDDGVVLVLYDGKEWLPNPEAFSPQGEPYEIYNAPAISPRLLSFPEKLLPICFGEDEAHVLADALRDEMRKIAREEIRETSVYNDSLLVLKPQGDE